MPKGLPWFRLYAEFAFDPKMQTISETLQRRYIMLLCLKCHGDLPGLNDIQLSGALRISIDELQKTHKDLLEIGIITENYDIPKWSERQYLSDYSSLRVNKFRKKNETLLKRKRNVTETEMKRPLSVSVSDSVSKSVKLENKIKMKIEDFNKIWLSQIEFYMTKYPGLDYNLQKESIEQWIKDRPSKSLKKSNWNIFIQNWLSDKKPQYKKPFSARADIRPNVTDHRTKEQEISDLKYSIGCLEELRLDKTVHPNNFEQLPRLKERLESLMQGDAK